MKKLFTLLVMLVLGIGSMWGETSTWESKEGWVQSTGGVGSYTWFGVHTPGDASTKYSLTAIQLMQQTGNGNNDNYLAIARVSATSTLDANHVVAISDNHLQASQSTGTLETYNFSAGVELLGGTTYYFVFLSSNTPTDGAYSVRQGRLSLNHTEYGDYPYGNSYSMTSTHWLYYKATVESSPATDICTGDLLSGSISGSNNWATTWTSGTTPSFTLTSSAANINHKNDRTTGGLDIRSGKSTLSATYTLTAPTGYIISGYKLFGKALNGNQTVTPTEGGSAVEFTGIGNSLSVSGLRKSSTSFTLAGANNGLFLHALEVSLTPYSSITSLPKANNKAYVIANKRATFNFAENATGMNVVTPANTNLDNTQQQIALIYYKGNYYLYSVNAKKYLTANNTLTATPTDDEQINITTTGDATYPWFLKFKNVADKNINVNSTPELKIDDWSTIDDGNKNAIIEAGDFDPSEVGLVSITYTVTDKNGKSYSGTYFESWNGDDTAVPSIPGAYGATFSNKVFSDEGGYSLTADIDFGFPVSSNSVNNPTAIQSALGSSLWYTKDDKVIADNDANTTVYDVKADYYRWYIYPIFEEGEFYFALYNVGARKFIPNNPSTDAITATTLTDMPKNAGGFQFAHYNQGNGFYDKNSSKFLTINTSGTAQNIWLWNAGATATHRGSVMSFPELTIVSVSETFAALKNASKFSILEGSTVMGPSEFDNPEEINAAIDAAQEVADNSAAKYAFIESTNGTKIQNYLDQVDANGDLANIQFTMSKEYGTLILPCPCTRIDGLDIFSCSGRENNTLTLTRVEGNYEQNVPYIIHATEGNKYTIIGWDKGSTATHTVGWLTGVLNSETYIPSGSYMLATNKTTDVQAFYKVSGSGVKCAINKCYLTVPVGTEARTLYLDIDGEITAIEEVFGDETEQGAIYNLAGQRLTKVQKGINIINGKKIIK